MSDDSYPSLLSYEWRRAVRLRRSPRARHVRLKIYPSGEVELVVPQRFNERHLPAILDEHEPWVLRTLARLGTRPSAPRAIAPPASVELSAIGERWELEYLNDESARFGCREQPGGRLKLTGGTAWQPALKRWLARKGRQHLVPWLEQVSDEVALPFNGASVRGQKSRWGSCSAKHRINLNYALLFVPPACVRYLFVHELCHTVHLNHSPRYWQLVASKEPEYRQLEQALRRASALVPPWLHAAQVVPA